MLTYSHSFMMLVIIQSSNLIFDLLVNINITFREKMSLVWLKKLPWNFIWI